MKKRTDIFWHAAATTLCVSLTAGPSLAADENPFKATEVQKSNATNEKFAQGNCGGNCGANWEGRCGGMVDGMMMGGAMPRSLDPTELPEASTAGAKLVAQYCTQCHGLPSPKQHSAAAWQATVERMNTRMQWMKRNNSPMNINAPTTKELATLTAYLEKNASSSDGEVPSDGPVK
jgi:mono/diheme cytochrome c family protein